MALSDQALTTVARMQAELGQAVDEKILEPLIEEASAELQAQCNRFFYFKAGYEERAPGYGSAELRVKDHLPVKTLSEVRYDTGTTSSVVSSSSYRLDDPEVALITYRGGRWRYTGRHWSDITRDAMPGTLENLYVITYAGGYITPKQADEAISFAYDNEASGPFVVNETLTFGNGSTAVLHTLVDNGATGTMTCVLLTGAAPADDDTIVGATSAATADINGAVTLGVSTIRDMPFDIERAIIDMASGLWIRAGQDKGIVSKRVSKAAITYMAPGLSRTHLPPSAIAVIQRYMRRSIA